MEINEALKKLELLEKSDRLAEAMDTSKHETVDTSDYEYDDDYSFLDDDFDDEYLEEEVGSGTTMKPEVGDVAVLKIKLRNVPTTDSKKKVYDGCERRPVLIIRVKGETVDAIEITHRDTFKGRKLIPIGRLGSDTLDSYVNIYTVDDYMGLSPNYKFPKAFDRNNKPITIASYFNAIGVAYTRSDANEPLIVDYTYNKNFREQLDVDTMDQIFEALLRFYKYN